MKLNRLFLLGLAIGLAAGPAFAAPYASQIGVSQSTTGVGGGLDIDYVLNQVADSVMIEILDSGSSVVASFAGVASPTGEVSVAWDGTVDNAGGAAVPEGADYSVRVTCDVTVGDASWEEFASNRSLGGYGPATKEETLFDGYSGYDMLISQDPDSDLFGLVLATTSWTGTDPDHSGHVVFNPNLTINAGDDGFASRKLKHPDDPTMTGAASQATWGSDWDPDNPDGTWVVGQAFPGNVMYATNASGLDEFLVDADVDGEFDLSTYPRSIAVVREGGDKVAYMAHGTEMITKFELDSNNHVVLGSSMDILGDLTKGTGIFYSKDVEIDDSGNLYWMARSDDGTAGPNPNLFRFDAATVLNAATDELLEASASWDVTMSSDTHGKGVTISRDAEVYIATDEGIYFIDNVSTPTVSKDLQPSDRLVDFSTIGTGWNPSNYGGNLAVDYAGNVYFAERGGEQLRGFAPPGASSVAVDAPPSVKFSIVAVTGLREWGDFK